MGAMCCCFCVEDFEEYMSPNGSVYRHCMCLRCFIQQLLTAYTALFQRDEVHAVPSSIQGATPSASAGLSTSSHDSSLPDTYRSPPRPLPYDDDPRCSRQQRGLVSRREKASSHFHEESEPLRRSDGNSGQESLNAAEYWNGSDYEGGSKVYCSESSLKQPLAKVPGGIGYVISSSDDEDVCPTCLEEYTSENPRIMTQCSHHFHLGCIYEWMERSDTCPVCGKVMIFDETM